MLSVRPLSAQSISAS